MLITGEWYLCDDGVERPVVRGEVLAHDASWAPVLFLVDTGADRTVLSVDTLAALGLPTAAPQERLGGLGGLVESVMVQTTLRLTREHGGKAHFHGQFAATTEAEALDMSVLGRDITELFAVIVDRPGNAVCLVGQRHQYQIAVV